uniref:Hypothetical secreted peptide n=1 Tax=Rhipicephalus sanguineus TaxID=34632 RepID=C9W1G8_RHISA
MSTYTVMFLMCMLCFAVHSCSAGRKLCHGYLMHCDEHQRCPQNCTCVDHGGWQVLDEMYCEDNY